MKSPIKRGAFSPYLKVRMDLYNSPDIRQLRHDGAAEAFGCLLVIALDLSRNCGGIGTWDMLGEFAQKCRKSKRYIKKLITDYGLFNYNDAIFDCRLVGQSFSIESSLNSAAADSISTGARRTDTCAKRAPEDNDKDKEKEKQKKCVCPGDTHSEFETLRAGRRYASHGQPLTAEAPPQRRRNDMYSYLRHEWVPAEEFDEHAEMIAYRQLQEKGAI